MINLTPLLTEAADWGCHVRLLHHHLVSLISSVSIAKAVIRGVADYGAASPGNMLTGFSVINSMQLLVCFYLTHHSGGILFLYFSTKMC